METDARASSDRHGHLLWILALALLIRAIPLGSGLPYLGYVDEGHVLHPVITLLKTRGWDPGTYLFPSLTAYLITGLVHLARPVYRIGHGHSLLADLPADETYYDFVSPPEVILLGRTLIATFSVATVALVFVLARRIGGRRAAVLAGLMAALCPALVTRASIVIVDSVSTFFALATLYFAHRLEGPERDGSLSRAGKSPLATACDSILAGTCAGLAFTAKYTIGVVFLAVVLTILTRPNSLRERLRLLAWATGGAIGAAVIAMPTIVFRTRAVVAAVLEQSRLYANPSLFTFSFPSGGPGYFRQAILPLELGLPLSIAGVFGIGWMLARRSTRLTALGWALFTAALLAPLLVHLYQPFRNALPLVPPLCIAASLPLAGALSLRTSKGLLRALVALIVIGSLGISLVRWLPERSRLVDSRTSLVTWLTTHTRRDQEVLVLRDLAILPAELERVSATIRMVPWLDALHDVQTGRFDYFVTGQIDLSGPTKPEWATYRKRLGDATSAMAPETSFGSRPTPVFPNFWRYSDELIVVLRPPDTGPTSPMPTPPSPDPPPSR
jgi:hypothetical protein